MGMKDYELSTEQLYFLKQAHRREKNKKTADKIKSVYLLGSGWRVPDICEALLLDDNTIYRYYDIYEQEGLKGLLKNRHKGADTKLTDLEMRLLDDYLQAMPCQTTLEVIAYVDLEFDEHYSVSGMNALLKRLGYSYKKPQPVPGKADRQAQEVFLKQYRELRTAMQEADSLFFMDSVHPQHNSLPQYGWFKKGIRHPLKTNASRGRLNITAAVDIDTKDIYSLDDKTINEESILDLLFKLREVRPSGVIHIVLDNAAYHTARSVREAAEKLAIKLVYLPPYSPNLNIIERVWLFLKKNVIYNQYYPTFEAFRTACMGFLKDTKNLKHQLDTLLAENFSLIQ